MATSIKGRKRWVHATQTGKPALRRRGLAVRQTHRGRRGTKKTAIIAGGVGIALIVAVAAALGAGAHGVNDCCVGDPLVSVVFDQATANAAAIPLTGPLEEQFRRAADEHRSIRLIGIGGDGKVVSNDEFDMTPKLDNGTILKVESRAAQVIAEDLDKLAMQINDSSAAVPGQALFLGLQRLRLDNSKPIVIVSSLLDTSDPLDFRRLGWDVSPQDVIADLRKSGELPDLKGADITFVVRPVAGKQEQLRPPQTEYRESIWRALAEASGASEVRFVYAGGSAPASTVEAPVIPIPPPPTTPVPVNSKSGTCTVDASSYFIADAALLLDPPATKAALKECVAQIGPNASVRVVGHTAGSEPNSEFALQLSRDRAQTIAELLESLGVPSGHIETIGMGNRNQPYPDPDDPRNRSVVVTIID